MTAFSATDLLRRIFSRGWREVHGLRTAAAQARWRQRLPTLPRADDGRHLLHLGCGDIDAPGFINVDARSLPHVHIVTKRLFDLYMVPDGAVDLVYMCHVLEHVAHQELHPTLVELRRVLKAGGLLRVSVPDFDKMLDIYHQTDKDILAIEPPMMGGQDYAFNFHYSLFNAARLKQSLEAAGFRDVQSWDPARCDHHPFIDWANRQHFHGGRGYDVSLNLEANAC